MIFLLAMFFLGWHVWLEESGVSHPVMCPTVHPSIPDDDIMSAVLVPILQCPHGRRLMVCCWQRVCIRFKVWKTKGRGRWGERGEPEVQVTMKHFFSTRFLKSSYWQGLTTAEFWIALNPAWWFGIVVVFSLSWDGYSMLFFTWFIFWDGRLSHHCQHRF